MMAAHSLSEHRQWPFTRLPNANIIDHGTTAHDWQFKNVSSNDEVQIVGYLPNNNNNCDKIIMPNKYSV